MDSFLDTLEDAPAKEENLISLPDQEEPGFLDTLEDEGEVLPLDEPIERISSYEPTIFDQMRSMFRDPAQESAKATLALVDSKMLNISPSQAMRLRGPIDRGVKINPAAAKIRQSLTQRLGSKLDKGYAQVNSGLWNYELLSGNENPEVVDGIKQTEEFLSQPEAIPSSRIEEAVGSAAEMFPFFAESAKHGGWRGVILAGGTMLMGTAAGVPEVAYPLAAPMYAVGQTSASLEFVSKVEAGLAYSELRNFKDKKTGEQIDPNIAKAAAHGVGAINGLIELAQMKTLIKTIPGGKKLVSGLILDTVKDVVEKKSLHNIAAKYATKYGKTVATETLQETAQESTNIVADIFSKKLTNALNGTNLSPPEISEITKRLTETMKTSAQAFSVMSLPGSVVSGGTEYYQGKKEDKADQELQDRANKIYKATVFQGIKKAMDPEASQINITPEEVQTYIQNPERSNITDADLDAIISEMDESEVVDQLIAKFHPEMVGGSDQSEDAPASIGKIANPKTETPEFKSWFGESKVVDPKGEPLVVYHGSPNEFTEFSYDFTGQQGRSEGAGFYFTDDKGTAEGYGKDGTVFEVYLDIKKPMNVNTPAFDEDVWVDILQRTAEIEHEDDPEVSIDDGFLANFGGLYGAVDLTKNEDTALDQMGGVIGSGVLPEHINQAVMEVTGIDGVFSKGFGGEGKGGGNIYVAFSPTQIKSIHNQGTFDPNNPNINAKVGTTKTNQPLPKFKPENIQHVGLKEATESGLISDDEAAVIDGILQMFPDAWKDHFEPRFSDQQFAPTKKQLKDHRIRSQKDQVVQGVLLGENVQGLKDDTRSLAIMFAGSDITTFFHEFGEFAYKRLLTAEERNYITKTAANKAVGKAPNEYFSDGIREYMVREADKDDSIYPPKLKKLLNKVAETIKAIWERIRWRQSTPAMDKIFKDILTGEREIQSSDGGIETKTAYRNKDIKEKSLFSAIKEFGGINFGKPGTKGLQKGMGLLSRKDGLTLRQMDAKLRQEGWIRKDENLLDMMKNNGITRTEAERREINLSTIADLGGRDALRRALMVALQDARRAYAEGNMEGVEEGKARIRAIVAKSQAAQKLRNEAKKLRNQIKKELKKSKVKKQSGKPIGKFGAERQAVLDILRLDLGLSQGEAGGKLLTNLAEYTETLPPAEIALENKLLAMLSTSLFEIDAEVLEGWGKLLKSIKAYKSEGTLERDLKAVNRGNLMAFYRQEVIALLGGIPTGIDTVGEGAVTDESLKAKIRNALFAGEANNFITGWKDLLDILSYKDKGSKPGESIISKFGDVLDVKNAEKLGNMNAMEELRDMAFEVFGFKSDRQMVKQFEKDSVVEDLGTFRNAKDEIITLKMSKAQARKRVMEMMDPTLHETIFSIKGMAWTEEMVSALNDFLNAQDEEFITRQMEFYRGYYKSVNDVYSEIYGVNLPKNDFYSPLSRAGVPSSEDAGMGEFIKEMPFRASATSAGSLKSRTANLLPLKERNDIEVLMSHVAEMEHFKAWSFKIRDFNAVFGSAEVRQAIRIHFGKSVDKHIQSFIKAFAANGAETALTMGTIDKIRSRYTRAVLAAKPVLFIKQLTSSVAYADNIPVSYFAKEFIKLHQLPEAVKVLMQSTLMKHRWEKGSMERDIKTAMASDQYAAFRTSPSFINAMMFLIKLGDAGAIIAGGYPVYKYHIEQGKTHEEALRIFESVTESTQQSSDLSEQSEWQRGGSFAKLFTMFRSSPNQYLRKEIGALRNVVAGRVSKAQFMKTFAIYHFILPMLFQWVSDRFTWDEDEQKRAMILGSLNGYFILGDFAEAIIRMALGMKVFDPSIPIFSITKDIEKAMKFTDPDEMDTEDFLRAVRGIAGASGVVAGLPLKQAFDVSNGFSETLSGEYEIGIAEMMGWSPYKAEAAAED